MNDQSDAVKKSAFRTAAFLLAAGFALFAGAFAFSERDMRDAPATSARKTLEPRPADPVTQVLQAEPTGGAESGQVFEYH